MSSKLFIFLVLILLLFPSVVSADGDVAILTPTTGESVKGRVEITGYIKASNYSGFELEFADDQSDSPGWYPINSGAKLIGDESFGIWDTTLITDGNYQIRLTVKLNDGTTSTTLVRGIRVRNYTPVEAVTQNSVNLTPAQSTPTRVSLIPADDLQSKVEKNPADISTGRYQVHIIFAVFVGLTIGVVLTYLFRKQKPRL